MSPTLDTFKLLVCLDQIITLGSRFSYKTSPAQKKASRWDSLICWQWLQIMARTLLVPLTTRPSFCSPFPATRPPTTTTTTHPLYRGAKLSSPICGASREERRLVALQRQLAWLLVLLAPRQRPQETRSYLPTRCCVCAFGTGPGGLHEAPWREAQALCSENMHLPWAAGPRWISSCVSLPASCLHLWIQIQRLGSLPVAGSGEHFQRLSAIRTPHTIGSDKIGSLGAVGSF